MCWCNPNIRTPQCKSINCIPPTKQEPAIRPFDLPQSDMFDKETAIELLKKAGILNKDGNIAEPYR